MVGAPTDAPAARAETGLEDLDDLLAHLGVLPRDPQAAVQTLAQAEEVEREALRDLAIVETTLRRLVTTRLDVTERVSAERAGIVALEAASDSVAPVSTIGIAADTQDGRRDPDGPGTLSASSQAWELMRREIAAAQRRLAGLVDRLGEANVEIAHWQRQADGAARRAGSASARAIASTRRLAGLHEEGGRAADAVNDAVHALGESPGELVGVLAAFARVHAEQITSDFACYAPGSSPLWPSAPAPAYLPARGPLAGPLVSNPLPATDLARSRRRSPPAGTPGGTSPVAGPVTAQFGSSTPYFPTHWAVDLAARLYTPVVAAAAGRVAFAGLATPGEPHSLRECGPESTLRPAGSSDTWASPGTRPDPICTLRLASTGAPLIRVCSCLSPRKRSRLGRAPSCRHLRVRPARARAGAAQRGCGAGASGALVTTPAVGPVPEVCGLGYNTSRWRPARSHM